MALKLQTHEHRTRFRCGESIDGTASWQLDEAPRTAEVRLFWYTRGKGTEDVGVAKTVRFDHPQREDSREFQIDVPNRPYSFSGKLISLIWAIELLIEPGGHVQRLDLIISPDGHEIVLHQSGASGEPT